MKARGLLLGIALLGARPSMPDAFQRLPAEVREKATVLLVGRFTTERGPCEFLPDGTRRWPLLRGFTKLTVYRGEVGRDYVGVAEPGADLVEDREYLLALRPSKGSLDALRRRDGGRSHRDALAPDEVLAIVPIETPAGR
jgi:hypothetical protein